MISLDKTYTTRDGREVRIYAVDHYTGGEVCGACKGDDGHWYPASWRLNGSCNQLSDHDLIEVKPKITRTYWLVHARDGGVSRYALSEGHAKELIRVSGHREAFLAITGPHTVEFQEGDGL